jgi:hypothetical protein
MKKLTDDMVRRAVAAKDSNPFITWKEIADWLKVHRTTLQVAASEYKKARAR